MPIPRSTAAKINDCNDVSLQLPCVDSAGVGSSGRLSHRRESSQLDIRRAAVAGPGDDRQRAGPA